MLDTCSDIPPPPESDEMKLQGFQTFTAFQSGMVKMVLGSSEVWQPSTSSNLSWVILDKWWNRLIFIDNDIEFSRRKMVLCIADTDGGAHVDPELEDDYYTLSRQGSIGFKFFANGKLYIPDGPEKMILPQIGLEMKKSLKHAFPDIESGKT